MSKNKHAIYAAKKHKKEMKRKNKAKPIIDERGTVEERLARRLNRAVHQPHTRQYKEIPISELLATAKERIKELRFIHYYLIFAKVMCEKGAIKGTLNYNVVNTTHVIKSISERLNVIPLLEDESIVHVEMYDVGEKMSELSTEMNRFVTLLESHQKYLHYIIMKLGERLPEKKDGKPYEPWEIENEVLRACAIEYIGEHVYGMNKEKGNV